MLNDLDWIVVPGGPGLSKAYLEYGLSNFPVKKNLHYYDMFGSPESSNKNPTIKEMIEQIRTIGKNNHFTKYGLITHSFGNYIGLRNIEVDGKVQALLMLSPMPFTYKAWRQALINIYNTLPNDLTDKLTELSVDEEGSTKLFKMLYPYYVGDQKQTLPIKVRFDINSCNNISSQINDYDDRQLILSSQIPMIQIMGERDPFSLLNNTILMDKTFVLKGLGHYPFLEDSQKFSQTFYNAMELLCQQV